MVESKNEEINFTGPKLVTDIIMDIQFKPIGFIHTPYADDAPYTRYEEIDGEFYVELNKAYIDGLYLLDELNYCYLIFYIHKSKKQPSLRLPHRRRREEPQHHIAQPRHHPPQGHARRRGDPGGVTPARLALWHQGRR